MSARRDAALDYAAQGLPVFPLGVRSKVPTKGSHGFEDASAHREHVWRWWQHSPWANIGIPTGPASGWLVVDLDGAEGRASWERLTDEHGQVSTLVAQTGGNGLHLIFAYPAGAELGNTAGRLGRGIDTRASRGYIVVAPSVHPSGRLYRWLWPGGYPAVSGNGSGPQEPRTRHPWTLPRAPGPMPAWLVEQLDELPRRTVTRTTPLVVGTVPSNLPRHLRAQASEQPDGDRSRQTYRLVLAALEWGLDDGEVIALGLAHPPTVDKYATRAAAEIGRILARARPDHAHPGRPCDRAGCTHRPGWMR